MRICKIFNTKLFLLSLVLWCLPNLSLAAPNNTPDHWQCENKVAGVWSFGVAPYACDASTFGEDTYVWKTYLPLIFDIKKNAEKERVRYMDELAAVIRESAELYIRKRKPQVSQDEMQAFIHASHAMAHQESFWSHYRLHEDGTLKMMRGDYGHGHGLMQVDDRWHFVAVTKGTAWNVVNNIVYSLEEYYDNWEAATQAPCMTDPNDWRARARSAYSAYNGGASRICRWTNPDDKWARNDKGFIQKFDGQQWSQYIKDPSKKTVVNVPCLVDGNENCPMRDFAKPPEGPQPGKIYQNSRGEYCGLGDGGFICITNSKDLSCLQRFVGVTDESFSRMNSQVEKSIPREPVDRHSLCVNKTNLGVHPLGTILKATKAIYVRATPAGQMTHVLPEGALVQVFDFEVRQQNLAKRYYQIYWNGQWGYVYGGQLSDHRQWFKKTNEPLKGALIAKPGEKVRVQNSSGVNLRTTIGGVVLTQIPQNSELLVSEVIGRGDVNELYYKIEYAGGSGYIYSGRGFPEKTFSQWTRVVDSKE